MLVPQRLRPRVEEYPRLVLPATGDVCRRIVGAEPPPVPQDPLTVSRLAGELHDAWVDGEILGFPHDDCELAAAQRWTLRMAEIEARATRCRAGAT